MRGGSWRRKGCLCSGRAGLASDTDALQFDDAIWLPGFAKRRCRDVVSGNSGRSSPVEDAVVSVTVEDSGHFESVGFSRYCAMDEGDSERGESFLRN